MRVLFALTAVLASSAAVVLACSSNDTIVTPIADGGSGTDTGGNTESDADENPPDSGEPLSPTGCRIHSTGYLTAAKAETVAPPEVPGAIAWSDLEGALKEDAKVATVTLEEGQESAFLVVSDFKVNLPPDAETWGIEVELKRRAVDGGVKDSKIEVVIEGKPTRFKFIDAGWPRVIIGTHHYGQAVDTWGVDLLPADVKTTTFAAKVSARRQDGITGPVTATIDSLKVAVHYCGTKL